MGGGPQDAIDLTDYLAEGETDIDAAWAEAFALRNYVRLPAGEWQASSLNLGAGKVLLTDGFSTVIQQKSGLAEGTTLIRVTGSGAKLAPDSAITLRGNIATDTDEQHHGVIIRGAVGISDIVIGEVHGEDIRGDVIYVGGLATATVTDVTIGNVTGANILRNIVTVTGGQGIDISSIEATGAVGYMALCLEPNANSHLVKSVAVGSVIGGRAGIVGLSASQFVENVTVGSLDLNPAYSSNTTPEYSHFGDIEETGLWLRNCRTVTVGSYKARDFEDHAIKYSWNGGEMVGDDLTFTSIDWAGCNFGEATYNTQAQILNTDTVTFGAGTVVLPVGAGKRFYAASLTGVDAAGVTVTTA